MLRAIAEAASRRQKTAETLRVMQQGLGRPVISAKVGDQTVVVAGKRIHWSKGWKTFADFLPDYLKRQLGVDWGNAEIAKPLAERHPIMQWYDAFCRLQAKHADKRKDGIFSAPMTNVGICYLGLAYNLYLLDHNAELQKRLVNRLKDVRQFQGAYYELIVANCLLRAGFLLELEDEADESVKHCEFSARSKKTNRKYWIEAKMRSVVGLLGKTDVDGSRLNDPTSRLSVHLQQALAKPAADERMIFIDVNAEDEGEKASWVEKAERRLKARERDLNDEQKAYVFITNLPFHRDLDALSPHAMLVYGLGMSDFAKPGYYRLSDLYRIKQRHIDAHDVGETFGDYPQVPETLDGRPASEAFGNVRHPRIMVGETYNFTDLEAGGVVATVNSVAVFDNEKAAMIAVTTLDGRGKLLRQPLSDVEFEDYQKYGPAYFGEHPDRQHKSTNEFDHYEWLVRTYLKTPRERLLEWVKEYRDFQHLKTLRHEDLVLEYCERVILATKQTG